MKLSDKNLFVAMPVYRQMDVLTVQSLMRVIYGHANTRAFGMGIDFHVGECPIGRARNDLTHKFLENKEYTHILFVDADIVFSYEQVERILAHDADIVGGIYCIKSEGKVRPCLNTLATCDVPNAEGLAKMKYMGTGFLRISRRVFEVMIQEIGKDIAYTCDGDGKTIKYDFWRMGVHKGKDGTARWLSEDWQFCQFALECGFDIWADARILLKHSGSAVYPLQTQMADLYQPDQLQRLEDEISSRAQARAEGAGTVKESPPVAVPATP